MAKISTNLFIFFDLVILMLSLIILIFSALITHQEYTFRQSTNLFRFQLVESIIIVIINIIMDIKFFLSKYKGHNNYGMFIRFLLFYLILSCILLTFQRSDNINHKKIKVYGKTLLYIGNIDVAFIIASMILSFIVIDKRTNNSLYDDRVFNINSMENIDLLGGTTSFANSMVGSRELLKK